MVGWKAWPLEAAAPTLLAAGLAIEAMGEHLAALGTPGWAPQAIYVLAALVGAGIAIAGPKRLLLSLLGVIAVGLAFHLSGVAGFTGLLVVAAGHVAGFIMRILALGRRPGSRAGKAAAIAKALEGFTPEPVRDEEDLEKQLTQYLRAKGFTVERQPTLRSGLRADLRVDECIVEVKIARRREDLRRLLGQAVEYLEETGCLLAVILDPGLLDRRTLSSYAEKLRKIGARAIIVQGEVKRV